MIIEETHFRRIWLRIMVWYNNNIEGDDFMSGYDSKWKIDQNM